MKAGVNEMPNDRVIVIGAGMGGLTAALELAHRGLDVTVLEARAAPGGKMREQEVGASRIDGGPTVFTMRWIFEALFEAVGERLDDHLALDPASVLARHAWEDGSRLDLWADAERSEAAVAAFAGGDEAARFRAFSDRARRVYGMLAEPFVRAQKPGPLDLARAVGWRPAAVRDLALTSTLWGALGRELRDPRLRQLFGRYATYVGGSPFLSPALLMLIWHVEASGVWLARGGMHGVARTLARLAEARGARVRHGAPVARIEADSRVRGVVLASGERLPADAIVFNGDVGALGEGWLGPDVIRAVGRVPRRARSLSALTLAIEAEATGFPLVHHTVFFNRDYRGEFREIGRGRLPSEPTVYLCAQDRPGIDQPRAAGPERFLAVINAPANGDHAPATDQEIETCRTRAIERMGRAGLRLRNASIETTPPAEFERLFPGTGGALYGRSPHGAMASFLRPGARSRLPGLYLAGGSVHPGPGIPMAAQSGRLAAAALIEDRASTVRSRPVATAGGMSTVSAATPGESGGRSP